MKSEGQVQGCILRRSMVINPLDNDSQVRMLAIIPLLVEWELGVFCCFSQRALHGVHSLCSHRSAMRWAYAMPVCVLFLSSRSDIVFNPSAGAITDHIQSAKDIDSYFKSQLYVEDPLVYFFNVKCLILIKSVKLPEYIFASIIFISARISFCFVIVFISSADLQIATNHYLRWHRRRHNRMLRWSRTSSSRHRCHSYWNSLPKTPSPVRNMHHVFDWWFGSVASTHPPKNASAPHIYNRRGAGSQLTEDFESQH